MNVSDQIIQVIEHLAQKFGVAINWSSENIMPIVEELCTKYISYEIMTSKMWLILCSVLFGIIVVVYGVICWHFSRDSFYDVFDYVILTLLLALPAILCAVAIIIQISDIIRCTTFPELQIFNYIQGFINQ
jgi:hypothetical protein